MKLLFILISCINGFIINKYIRFNTKLNSLLHIHPSKTIAYYLLNHENKQKINLILNNRFTIEPLYINNKINDYIGITLIKYNTTDNSTIIYKNQLFVYTKDNKTNKIGQYILESTEYNYGLFIAKESILCSFYSNNNNYTCMISYSQDILDIKYYSNYNYFDFIYENDKLYMNVKENTNINNLIYYPEYKYDSLLTYNNMYWKNSDMIIYYKNSFYYK